MIVSKRFDGDNNDALQWAQHDVYDKALNIMVTETCIVYQNAHEVLKDFGPDPMLGPLRDVTYDHRSLQAVHDHMAAYWRIVSGHSSPSLIEPPVEKLMEDWQSWLRAEVRGWFYENPTAITTLRAVLTSQQARSEVAEICENNLRHIIGLMYKLEED